MKTEENEMCPRTTMAMDLFACKFKSLIARWLRVVQHEADGRPRVSDGATPVIVGAGPARFVPTQLAGDA
jgi:hypothetical protein